MTDGFDPNDIPQPDLGTGWEDDSTSAREERYWGDYEKVTRIKNNNTANIHRVIGWCIPVAIVSSFTGFLVIAAVYIVHIVGPICWRWLSTEEVDAIHNMLFSGVVGAAVTQGTRIYLQKTD